MRQTDLCQSKDRFEHTAFFCDSNNQYPLHHCNWGHFNLAKITTLSKNSFTCTSLHDNRQMTTSLNTKLLLVHSVCECVCVHVCVYSLFTVAVRVQL